LLLLHLVGSSILLYLHWWYTIKHKSNSKTCLVGYSLSTGGFGT